MYVKLFISNETCPWLSESKPKFNNLCVLMQSAYVGFPIQQCNIRFRWARLLFDGINMMRPLGLLMYMGRLTRTFCITLYWLFMPPPMTPPPLLRMSRDGQDVILVWPIADLLTVWLGQSLTVGLWSPSSRGLIYVSAAILEISCSVSAFRRHRQDTIGYLNR